MVMSTEEQTKVLYGSHVFTFEFPCIERHEFDMVKGEQSPGQLDGEACCPGFVKGLLVR